MGPPSPPVVGRLHRETALILADAEAEGCRPARGWTGRRHAAVFASRTAPERYPGQQRFGRDLAFDPPDRSVQFHACFGPTRQVEALRDTLLHLLDEGAPELTEEDILVVCPSLERFAPLIEAVFGPSVDRPPRRTTGADPDRWWHPGAALPDRRPLPAVHQPVPGRHGHSRRPGVGAFRIDGGPRFPRPRSGPGPVRFRR